MGEHVRENQFSGQGLIAREIVYRIAYHALPMAATAGLGYLAGYGMSSINNLFDALTQSSTRDTGIQILDALAHIGGNPDALGKAYALAGLAAYVTAHTGMAIDRFLHHKSNQE